MQTFRDMLLPEFERRFGSGSFVIVSRENLIATFPGRHAGLKEIQVWDDGHEVTVDVAEITHGHFYRPGEDATREDVRQDIAESVLAFLERVFADEVMFWSCHSPRSGGWVVALEEPLIPKPGATCCTWSGPL